MRIEPLHTLDHIRKAFNDVTNRTGRARIGQFLTPSAIARFMSSMFETFLPEVRILDPRAGAGILFAALVETLISRKNGPLSIEVVAYETDSSILPFLRETVARCEALCASNGANFRGIVKHEDFVSASIAKTRFIFDIAPSFWHMRQTADLPNGESRPQKVLCPRIGGDILMNHHLCLHRQDVISIGDVLFQTRSQNSSSAFRSVDEPSQAALQNPGLRHTLPVDGDFSSRNQDDFRDPWFLTHPGCPSVLEARRAVHESSFGSLRSVPRCGKEGHQSWQARPGRTSMPGHVPLRWSC